LQPATQAIIGATMSIAPPEIALVETRRVWCDGATDIRGGANYRPAALGHPKVYLEIDEHGYVDCGYCDRRFILKGGPAEGVDQASLVDVAAGGDPGHR
jgi:NADH dehydrogenase (ubiquinone) Fe-S protein 6